MQAKVKKANQCRAAANVQNHHAFSLAVLCCTLRCSTVNTCAACTKIVGAPMPTSATPRREDGQAEWRGDGGRTRGFPRPRGPGSTARRVDVAAVGAGVVKKHADSSCSWEQSSGGQMLRGTLWD